MSVLSVVLKSHKSWGKSQAQHDKLYDSKNVGYVSSTTNAGRTVSSFQEKKLKFHDFKV